VYACNIKSHKPVADLDELAYSRPPKLGRVEKEGTEKDPGRDRKGRDEKGWDRRGAKRTNLKYISEILDLLLLTT